MMEMYQHRPPERTEPFRMSPWKKWRMSLRLKIFCYLFVVIVLLGVLDYGVQRLVVLPKFIALEQNEAKKNMMRGIEALRREITHLDFHCWDWAAWDETYEFIETQSDTYIKANLVLETFADDDLNALYFFDTRGNVIWGETRDQQTEIAHLPEFPDDALPLNHPLLSYKAEDKPLAKIKVSGIYRTSKGPMLISSRPILTSHSEGPIRGSVIIGKHLSDKIIKKIVDQTHVPLHIWPASSDSIPEADKKMLKQITVDNPFAIREQDENLLNIYSTFPDIQGASALLMRADLPRKIRAEGTKALWMAMISLLVASMIVLTVLWGLLERSVLSPIKRLTGHAGRISRNNDFSMRINIPLNDEIGALATTFDSMVGRVEEQTTDLTRINEELKTQIAEREMAQQERENLILDLQEALFEVKTLSGLLPLCASCKKVRDDNGYWRQLEAYIQDHSEAEVSHGICPDCAKELYPDYADEMHPETQGGDE